MAAWPETLPQSPLAAGFSEQVPNTLIRTEMDAGPAKVRRRFTAGVRKLGMSMLLTKAQIAILDTFVVTTTNGGADQWTWENPRTKVTTSFRFVNLPTYKTHGGDDWTANFQVDILP